MEVMVESSVDIVEASSDLEVEVLWKGSLGDESGV